MTREEAIKYLSEELEKTKEVVALIERDFGVSESVWHTETAAFKLAIAALREQDSNANQHVSNTSNALGGWISVEERLPSGWWIEPDTGYGEPEEYIVFVKGAILPTFANFIEGRFVRPGAIYREDGSGFADDITHWMPLPEPPEVEV